MVVRTQLLEMPPYAQYPIVAGYDRVYNQPLTKAQKYRPWQPSFPNNTIKQVGIWSRDLQSGSMLVARVSWLCMSFETHFPQAPGKQPGVLSALSGSPMYPLPFPAFGIKRARTLRNLSSAKISLGCAAGGCRKMRDANELTGPAWLWTGF